MVVGWYQSLDVRTRPNPQGPFEQDSQPFFLDYSRHVHLCFFVQPFDLLLSSTVSFHSLFANRFRLPRADSNLLRNLRFVVTTDLCGTWAGGPVWSSDNSYAGQSQGSCAAMTGFDTCAGYVQSRGWDFKHGKSPFHSLSSSSLNRRN